MAPTSEVNVPETGPPAVAGRLILRFWAAATISSFGTAITAVAVPVLVVRVLGAAPWQVGLASAAQLLPYALLGLVAGVYVDRWPRRTVLVWASLGRAVALALVPVLALLDILDVWTLSALLVLFGTFSVFGFAATQSLLPALVPTSRLVTANARLDQADAAAQTLGPVLGGGLIALIGAPLAIAVDAVSYLVHAALSARLPSVAPTDVPRPRRRVREEVKEGLRFTYHHRLLAPLALSTHVWFLANAASLTALSLLVLRTWHLSPVTYSLLLATSGLATLVGASAAPAVGRRWGSGPTIVASRAVYPLAWLAVALTLDSSARTTVAFVALAFHGLAAGVENPHEMHCWQALTPDVLLGRVNASRRSVNRSVGAIGAVVGGVLLSVLDASAGLTAVAVVFGLAAALAGASPLRSPNDTDS